MSSTQQKCSITLKGSTEIVSKFFYYGLNSILYQRGLYPPEQFSRIQEYGLTLLVARDDDEVTQYLDTILKQVTVWLEEMTVHKLVLVIKDKETEQTLERWQFDVECTKSSKGGQATDVNKNKVEKTEKEIRKEISDVIRQITASVTFLPLLDAACVIDILVYTDKDLTVPDAWKESSAHLIENSAQVRLRSFSTTIHKVDTMVSYKVE